MKKIRFVTNFGEKNYIARYTQEEIQLLMRVKLNMLRAENNYGMKGECRLCKAKEENTEHLGKCSQINTVKITKRQIKSEKAERERKVINRYKEVERRLNKEEQTNQ